MKTPTRAGGLMEMQGKSLQVHLTDNYSPAKHSKCTEASLVVSQLTPTMPCCLLSSLGKPEPLPRLHMREETHEAQENWRSKRLAPQLVSSTAEIQACGSLVLTLTHHSVCVCGGDAKAGRKCLAAGYSAQGTKAPLRRVRAAYETEQEKMRSRDGL